MAIRERDLKLDLFRGLSLFIILIDHTRGNVLARWTPGQFGLSDAAAVFICVSGYTVALAFGRVFEERGWLLGTARLGLRMWQLYIAQLALLIIVASLPSTVWHLLGADGYGATLKLDYLFVDPGEALWRAVTLTYVPPGLDILPVYIAMMAMIPGVMALARVNRLLVPVASLALWAAAWAFDWNLLADPSDGRGWFFDPFSWQLLFVGSFGLGMGWFAPPPRLLWLRVVAGAMLVFGFCVQVPAIWHAVPALATVHGWTVAPAFKTMLNPLEYAYFLALAYLVVPLFERSLNWFRRRPLNLLVVAGQQSLAAFLGTVILADLGGVVFDVMGRGPAMQVAVNLGNFTALAVLASLVAWYKTSPWRSGRGAAAAEPDGGTPYLGTRLASE
jgi:hypothetical protein